MKELQSTKTLKEVIPNIAQLLDANARKFAEKESFFIKKENQYSGITWKEFYWNLNNLAKNLREIGFKKGDKMVFYSPNCLEMLQLELAVMASGGIAVPIFAYFHRETADLLISFSDAEYLVVKGNIQLERLGDHLNLKKIITIDSDSLPKFQNQITYDQLLVEKNARESVLDFEAHSDEICLNMFTSGTMGIPKCVQLTHRNILSQQAALSDVWQVDSNDRMLSFLPWHHSFGGIFEIYTALYNGSSLYLESSFGKEIKQIAVNWEYVKPTLCFSVPKVYQSLFDLTQENRELEKVVFHDQLKFIFTAAASLPQKLSNEFEKRGITVLEGWGLTETSPCCTMTDPNMKRETGVVGFPLPGINIRIADDDEIQVSGPNVMAGYYKNDEANQAAFTSDGWYRTGDVGQVKENGLKLISRKDRIFKLSNGEKVIPSDLEKAIELKCHYVQYAIVAGNGYDHPVALIFPNKKLLDKPDYYLNPDEGCFCPRNINELGRCLTGCLHLANESIGQKFAKIKSAAIINDELSLESNTLTPSMKMAPKNVVEKYRSHLLNLYGESVPVEEEVYIVELNLHNR